MSDKLSIPSLDGIRAVSILLVLVSPCGLGKVVPGGLGVTIFFFLSGYLITTLMRAEWARTGTINIPHFYARRAFRLAPPLLVTLAIAYALYFMGLVRGGASVEGFLSQLLYFANYYVIFADNFGQIPYGTGALWSLAVEEHFYIIYPLVMLMLLAAFPQRRGIVALFAAVCLAVLAWRFYLAAGPHRELRIELGTDTRIDSILYGCITALLFSPIDESNRGGRMQPSHWGLLGAALLLLLGSVAIRNTYFKETLRYTMQGIAVAPIFYLSVRFFDQGPFRILNWAPMRRIGVWSYAIYLIHHVAAGGLALHWPWLESRPLLYVLLVLPISCAYGAAIDRLVDPYFRKLRSRFRDTPVGHHARQPELVPSR
ncbi:MAG: acyltransferase family protein [Hyphomicrobiaceae bacterium]